MIVYARKCKFGTNIGRYSTYFVCDTEICITIFKLLYVCQWNLILHLFNYIRQNNCPLGINILCLSIKITNKNLFF